MTRHFLLLVLIVLHHWSVNSAAPGSVPTKESRIILPKNFNNGSSLDHVRVEFEDTVTKSFGGFTRMDGTGGWLSDTKKHMTETVWIYDIAVLNTQEIQKQLFDLAVWIKEKAAQQSVYLRQPSGSVQFV